MNSKKIFLAVLCVGVAAAACSATANNPKLDSRYEYTVGDDVAQRTASIFRITAGIEEPTLVYYDRQNHDVVAEIIGNTDNVEAAKREVDALVDVIRQNVVGYAKKQHRLDLTDNDVTLVEMPPPEMPAALYAKAVDAYATGEPFGALAQRKGYARILHMTRDECATYICCVLTVRQELIDENPAMVQDLVNQVQGAGVWLDEKQENRNKAVAIAVLYNFTKPKPTVPQTAGGGSTADLPTIQVGALPVT